MSNDVSIVFLYCYMAQQYNILCEVNFLKMTPKSKMSQGRNILVMHSTKILHGSVKALQMVWEFGDMRDQKSKLTH